MSEHRPTGVVQHMRRADVAALPAVPEQAARRLQAVRQVPGPVRVRQSVRRRPALDLRLDRGGHEVTLQVQPAVRRRPTRV